MQRGILVFAISLMVAAPAVAQNGRGVSHRPQTVKTTVKSQPVAKGGPKTVASKPTAAKVKVSTAKTTTPKGHAKATTPKTTTKTTTKTPTTTTTKASKTPTGTTTTASTLSPVQQKLQRNTNLASKLQGRLPAGTDLMTAAAGFRNLGQFVAAVNASYNHKLSFTELKMRMVDQGMSLGQAVKEVRALSTTTTTTTTTRKTKKQG